MKPHLIILNGSLESQTFFLEEFESFSIGFLRRDQSRMIQILPKKMFGILKSHLK